MSDSGPSNDTPSPGGEVQNIIPVYDRDGCTLMEYSWSDERSVVWVIKYCAIHGPTDACHCEVTRCPTPLSERIRYSQSRAWGSESDATIAASLERPSAEPQRPSPDQLPPLCDDADSDDELFTATHGPAGTADDGSDCEHEEPVRVDVYDGLDTGSLDVMCRTISWLADLAADVPAQADFTFVPPATAPKYPSPLRIECSKEQLPLATVQRLALVASLLLNRPHYPPPYSSDPENFEPDESLVSYLQRPGVLSGKYEATTHQMLLEHSDPDMRGAYCKASRFIQRAIRPLITTFPWISVDILTPLEAFPCVLPGCDKIIQTTRLDAERHVREYHSHSSRARPAKLVCPPCGRSMLATSMGRHMVDKHGRDTVVCTLCRGDFPGVGAYADHFAECQEKRTGDGECSDDDDDDEEEEEVCARAPKRRRVEE